MNRSHENKRRCGREPLVRVYDTNDLLDCAGWVPVPRRHYEKLKDLRWVAEPPEEPLDSLDPADVALYTRIDGLGLAIFLPDLVAALDRPEAERRIVLASLAYFGGEAYCEARDWRGYNRDIQWSAIEIDDTRYRIDTADLLILDDLGFGWTHGKEAILAYACEVAGVDIYVTLDAAMDAARETLAAGSRGDQPGGCMLYSKQEWMEEGGTEETWEPRHWCG